MSVPLTYSSRTSRFGLPLLFAGQAQKEFFINEAFALVDALLQPVIMGEAATPPAQPEEGSCWLVGTDASDSWTGHEGEIACYQAGSWLFAAASDGMRAFDRSRNAFVQYLGGWSAPMVVAAPSGGTTVDTEARLAVAALIEALAASGTIIQS